MQRTRNIAPTTMQGTLHTYHPTRPLLLFEHHNAHTAQRGSAAAPPGNTLLFVGGMYDNFLTPPYTSDVARLLAGSTRWRFAHVQLSSAMRGFGTSSLAKDVAELGVAVQFAREQLCSSGGGKVVLMGHSTGCQDLLSYVSLEAVGAGKRAARPRVDGIVLQAPVSDREGAMPGPDASDEQRARWRACLEFAGAVDGGKQRTTVLPMHLTKDTFGPAPLSVERFLSLASPGSPQEPGEDDLFSSDCSVDRMRDTWGRIGEEGGVLNLLGTGGREALVLIGGSDEHMPERVDKVVLLERWRSATEERGGRLHRDSQVVENGLHDLGGDEYEGKMGRLVVMRGALMKYLDNVLGDGPEKEVEQVWQREKDEIEAGRPGLGGVSKI